VRQIELCDAEYIRRDGTIRKMLETVAELDQMGNAVARFGKPATITGSDE